jgi:hypothetical protein
VLPQHLSGFSQLDPEWWWRILSPLEAAGYTGYMQDCGVLTEKMIDDPALGF